LTVASAAAAHALTSAVLRSYLLPSALEAVSPVALAALTSAAGIGTPAGRWGVLLLAEGLPESRTRHVDEMRTMAASSEGAGVEVYGGNAHEALWRAVAEFPSPGAHPGGVVFRAGTPIARWLHVAEAAGAVAGPPPAVVAHAGVGLTYVAGAADQAPALAQALGRAVAAPPADALGGYAVVEVAPAALKASLPVWGEAPSAVDLMRRLRAQYDPKGIMVPGRLGWLS